MSEKFGEPQRVISVLRAYRLPSPQPAAVQKWYSRSSIPSEWFAIMLYALELESGKPVSLKPFLT